MYKRKIRLAALVIGIKKERAILKVYNTISKDDNLEYIGPNMKTISIGKIILLDKDNNIISKVNHTDYVEAELWDYDGNPILPQELDILRMEAKF